MNLVFFTDRFLKSPEKSYFMKIRPVGVEFFFYDILPECFEYEIHNVQLEESNRTFAVFVALKTTNEQRSKIV
jgi:hypothetical protein